MCGECANVGVETEGGRETATDRSGVTSILRLAKPRERFASNMDVSYLRTRCRYLDIAGACTHIQLLVLAFAFLLRKTVVAVVAIVIDDTKASL